jgi:hypothetical protein
MTTFYHKEKHFVKTCKGTINANKEQRNESENSSPLSTYYPEQFGVEAVTRLTLCLDVARVTVYRDWKFLSFMSYLLRSYGMISLNEQRLFKILFFCVVLFFLLKGPLADATDAPQPRRLIVQPYKEDEKVFFRFSVLMEHRWNEIDRGKPKYSEKNLSQCHFSHQKSNMDLPGIEPGPPR